MCQEKTYSIRACIRKAKRLPDVNQISFYFLTNKNTNVKNKRKSAKGSELVPFYDRNDTLKIPYASSRIHLFCFNEWNRKKNNIIWSDTRTQLTVFDCFHRIPQRKWPNERLPPCGEIAPLSKYIVQSKNRFCHLPFPHLPAGQISRGAWSMRELGP